MCNIYPRYQYVNELLFVAGLFRGRLCHPLLITLCPVGYSTNIQQRFGYSVKF